MGASRRMAIRSERAAILRDGRTQVGFTRLAHDGADLGQARDRMRPPQDEVSREFPPLVSCPLQTNSGLACAGTSGETEAEILSYDCPTSTTGTSTDTSRLARRTVSLTDLPMPTASS